MWQSILCDGQSHDEGNKPDSGALGEGKLCRGMRHVCMLFVTVGDGGGMLYCSASGTGLLFAARYGNGARRGLCGPCGHCVGDMAHVSALGKARMSSEEPCVRSCGGTRPTCL